MILVVFRSRFSEQYDHEYETTEDYLAKKVRAVYGDDLVQVKNYETEDGERLALVWWRDPETLARWRADVEHHNAQQQGKEKWYAFYELTVAEVVRTSSTLEPEAYPAP
ncbi:antibiotic biosynthesis monooxygenase family protein [Kitasatospora sp. NPDC057518]|uniref:antibiotic biosynthesis monooxygenase family protein n=1 Tax=Kitasatospora sp. NPDC057518 TaxID=3346155 RepID=UPI00367C7342